LISATATTAGTTATSAATGTGGATVAARSAGERKVFAAQLRAEFLEQRASNASLLDQPLLRREPALVCHLLARGLALAVVLHRVRREKPT
jgi:hypothetical protein